MLNRFAAVMLLVTGLGLLNPALAQETRNDKDFTPQARQLVEKIKTAYSQLQSMQATGKVAATLDVGGRKSDRSADVSAIYRAPGLFHHEVKGELVAGSTGEKFYVLDVARNIYMTVDAPEKRVSYRDLPRPFGELLEVQDPALQLALSANSITDVLDGAKRIKQDEDTVMGSEKLPTLTFNASDGRVVSLAFDPTSSLLRQARYDISELLQKRGAEKVEKALVTISYDQVTPGVNLEASRFAWTPPANAREASDGNSTDAALALEGKAAPDFTLPGMDGKPVTLASLKGNVVLLDFWATWCGPCVVSLPDLDKLYQERKDQKVKVLAVNVGEEKDEVASFLTAKKLTLPVLLDTDQAVTEKFGITGYPTTVIINPEGVVTKVFLGVPRGGKEELAQALDTAAKK